MIKKFIVSHSLQLISDMYPDYNSAKIDEIRYGLESIYLSITKVAVILIITLLLGIFKESLWFLLFFNGLRTTAFGIHASKSWMCWLSSILLFIGIPYFCIYVPIPEMVQYIIIILSILCFLLYAPSDTKKRPLVRKHRRIKFKILTLLVAGIYLIIFFNTNSVFIKNAIIFSMVLESVLVHPLTYGVFHLPYKNYERYVFSK